MNELQVFKSDQFGQIRTASENGEPLFVAADVCRALGLDQVSRAMDRLDEDERVLLKVTHPQSASKTMDVLVPEGRMKPSGVRGRGYSYFTGILCLGADGERVTASVKAMCWDNAVKQFNKMGLTPI